MASKYALKDLQLNDIQRNKKVMESLKGLILNIDMIRRVSQVFESELNNSLNDKPSSLQMVNTYIPELPDDTEEGLFLALDLGGTNLRILLLEYDKNGLKKEIVENSEIGPELRIGCGENLFDYLAQCLDTFIRKQKLEDVDIALGFTFSFPVFQHSLVSANLKTWTKTFNCPSVVGKDVVQLLYKSLRKYKRDNVEIVAILNDTTGTLVQGAKIDKNTRIGIVLGTGTNGAYLERANRVKHWETERHGEQNVIIDIEWGAFGDNGVLDFIKTDFDRAVDEGSLLKNSFTFEKYIAGNYLGEIARVIFKHLYDQNLLFTGANPLEFPKPWKFITAYVSKIEEDVTQNKNNGITEVLNIFNYQYGKDYGDEDIKIIRYICGLISKRAAQLTAGCIGVLLNRMSETDVTIAIDGSLYKFHPRLKHWIEEYTTALAPNTNIKFILAEDGSGKGAGLVAAIAVKLKERCEHE